MQRVVHNLLLTETLSMLLEQSRFAASLQEKRTLSFLNSGYFLVLVHRVEINLSVGWHFMNSPIVYTCVIYHISQTSLPIFQLPVAQSVIEGPVSS